MTTELDLVYIVDDDEIIIFLTNKLLMSEQFCKRVMMFQDAEIALETLRASLHSGQDVPDAILFDLDMPVMDGWEFIDEVRKLPVHIPSFVFTSSINPSDKKRADMYHGIRDFITKPLNKIKLQKILRQLYV